MSDPEELLNMFKAMGTTDHDTLVQQMMAVVSSPDPQACQFFLEANSWNLQAAISSFYESGNNDLYYQLQHLPQMALVGDYTIDNTDGLLPQAPFRQTWRVKNTGTEAWPNSMYLIQLSGHVFPGAPRVVPVPGIQPGEETDIVVPMRAPSRPGSYAASWRLCSNEGGELLCGEQMWIVANVLDPASHEVDDVEQQRLRLEEEHQLDMLTEGFATINYGNQGEPRTVEDPFAQLDP